MNAQAQRAKEVAERRRRSELGQLIAIAAIGWGLFILTAFWYSNPGTWRNDPAPPLVPFYAVTKAYVAKDGTWRSMDTGEEITVTHWTTKDY